MFNKICKLKVYIRDNDPFMQSYNVGHYEVKGCIMPYEMYDDLLMVSRQHDVYFSSSDVIDAFVEAILNGSGLAVSTDYSMFIQMEATYGN